MAQEMLDLDSAWAPGHAEVAAKMGISTDRYQQLSRLSQLGREVHFSAMEPPDDRNSGGTGRTWDVRAHDSDDPSKIVASQLLTDYITKGLAREERLVLVLYYYEGMTMAEIGLVLDLSESRVSQMHSSILARLKAQLNHRSKELQTETT